MKKYKILALLLIGALLGSVTTLLIKPLQAAANKTVPIITFGGFISDLSNAYFFGKDLSYHNFTGFNFSKSTLINVNLRKSNLSKADLSNAILCGVDLTDANLTGANISNITWHNGQCGTNHTICPDGFEICEYDEVNEQCVFTTDSCINHLSINLNP